MAPHHSKDGGWTTHPDRRHHHQLGRVSGQFLPWQSRDREALTGPDPTSSAHHHHLKGRAGHARLQVQRIRCGESVKNAREPGVTHSVDGEHSDAHGVISRNLADSDGAEGLQRVHRVVSLQQRARSQPREARTMTEITDHSGLLSKFKVRLPGRAATPA